MSELELTTSGPSECLSPQSSSEQLLKHSINLKDQFEAELDGTEKPEVKRLVDNARLLKAHRENHYSFALVVQALRMDSYSVAAIGLLHDLFEERADASACLQASRALVSVDYGFASLTRLAKALYASGLDEEALEAYQEALEVQTEADLKSSFEVYKNLGNLLVRAGDFEGAEEFYHKAHALDSESDTLFVNLGTLALQRGDYENAKVKFRSALEIRPENDKAWVGLGMVHNYFGDHVIALANLENALDHNPLNRTALQLLSQWCLRDQKYQTGIQRLQSYLDQIESDPDMSLLLVHFQCLLGNYRVAQLELERALLFEPTHKALLEVDVELCKRI